MGAAAATATVTVTGVPVPERRTPPPPPAPCALVKRRARSSPGARGRAGPFPRVQRSGEAPRPGHCRGAVEPEPRENGDAGSIRHAACRPRAECGLTAGRPRACPGPGGAAGGCGLGSCIAPWALDGAFYQRPSAITRGPGTAGPWTCGVPAQGRAEREGERSPGTSTPARGHCGAPGRHAGPSLAAIPR